MPYKEKRNKNSNANSRRQNLISRGLCRECQGPSRLGKTMCTPCAKKSNERCAERFQKQRDAGLCLNCSNPADSDRVLCSVCRKKQSDRLSKASELGLCTACKAPAVSGKKHCQECGIKHRLRKLNLLPQEKARALSALKIFKGKCQNLGCSATDSGIDGYEWCIDHDHATGYFRGVICHNCNVALGRVRDDIQVLHGLIEYLKKTKQENIYGS